MSSWVEQLKRSSTAGSYRLDCTIEQLQSCTQDAGLVLFEMDMRGVKGKQNFLAALAAAAKFPAEFGANWDALADALCDLPSAAGYVLLLRNASISLGLSAHDREIAQDIFADTVLYWQQRNIPFWIFYA